MWHKKAGRPARFESNFEAPSGSVIKITLEYQVKNKVVRVPAQKWIRKININIELAHDWVFAGSFLVPDEGYGANLNGDIICVANMELALLDLPIDSPNSNEDHLFEPHTERIPEEGTPVIIILEPVAGKIKR